VTARGDASISAAIVRTLASGPKDLVEIARGLRSEEPALFARREGGLHALLLARRRAGRLREDGTSERGLPRYRIEPGGAPALPAVPPRPPDRDAERIAAAVRDPAERARVEAEVAAHRADLAALGLARGFGSRKMARRLLQRADRGREAIAFPATVADHLRRFLQHEGRWLAGAVLAFFLVRGFLVEVFVIPSDSMVPTLLRGDRVAVLKPGGNSRPERWEVVTFEIGGVTYVKRAVCLGGELPAIKHGDVYADGVLLRKPEDLAEALRSPIAEWDLSVEFPVAPGGPPVEPGATWRPADRFYAHGPRIRPRAPAPDRGIEVRDGWLTLEVEPGPTGRAAIRFAREGILAKDPALEWTLEWTHEEGRSAARLLEESLGAGGVPTAPVRVLASTTDLPRGGARMGISYVDGVLGVFLGDWSWSGEREAPRGAARIGVDRPPAEFRLGRLRFDQDLHYSQPIGASIAMPPEHGFPGTSRDPDEVMRAMLDPDPNLYRDRVPEDALFLLGDNTTDSHDGRFKDFGFIPLKDLVGPVWFRIWPPARVGGVR
jgi:signal peptidase I